MEAKSAPVVLRVEQLAKAYAGGPPVLQGVDVSFKAGEYVAILGLSGAGKSTFLRCINRLIDPSSGRIWASAEALGPGAPEAGADVAGMNAGELRRWRRRVGMIFQQFNLVKRLSVLDNVLTGTLGDQPMLPSLVRRFPPADVERAMVNLERVGLLKLAYQRADALSGGQQQRVAIARALMQKPAIILADEPVASLDPKLSATILEILRRVAQEDGITVLVSLHVLDLAKRYADRILGFQGGRIAFDGSPESLSDQAVERIYQRGTAPLESFLP